MDLIIEKAAAKALRKMQPKPALSLLSRMESIADDPFANHANVSALKGRKDAFRLRQGDLRAVYFVDREQQTVHILDIDSRGGVYK